MLPNSSTTNIATVGVFQQCHNLLTILICRNSIARYKAIRDKEIIRTAYPPLCSKRLSCGRLIYKKYYIMKNLIILVSTACLLALASCGGGSKQAASDPKLVAEGPYETLVPVTPTSPAYVRIDRPTINLNEFQKDEDDFYIIFDGTFKGWRGYNKESVPPSWIIDDGALKIIGNGMGEAQGEDGGDLIFAYKFKNFELTFDWKVAKGSNSGVFYFVQEIKNEPIFISCPEYQLLDNANHLDARAGINGNRQSASLYDMIPAKPQNALPYDEWNTGAIIVYKGSVFHQQNGQTVLEYHLWTPNWTKMITDSKFEPNGDYPLAYDLMTNLGGANREGYIGFQDHGDDVWIKNIRIKILD